MPPDDGLPDTTLDACHKIDLPQFTDERGSLTYAEPHEQVPIDLRRVYYVYNVPPNETRGDHAHKRLEQVMIAVNGRMKVTLDDGDRSRTFNLMQPDEGLYIAPMTWLSMHDFSDEGVLLTLASQPHEDDYICDYDTFRSIVGGA